jgi:uncharacterized protein YgfB (UPF0149 family)
MEIVRKIFLEQIEPYSNTFNNLSLILTNKKLLSEVLLALQKIKPLYTRTHTRQFLSHYILYYFQNEVVGDICDSTKNVIQSSQLLFNVHLKNDTTIFEFENAFNEYILHFIEWQKFDKEKLAETYGDAYRLLSEIKVSSPIEIKEEVLKLERTLDKHTKQIFGVDAQKIVNVKQNQIEQDILHKIEKFVCDSIHEIYWQNMIQYLEKNSFDSLCTVIEHVKVCMLLLCVNQNKRDEVEACLDVSFLKNVLNVGMAQNQVKSLLKYCLCFLREYGQPCHDSEIDYINKNIDLLYTSEVQNTIDLLVNIIREIANRINKLLSVVYDFINN